MKILQVDARICCLPQNFGSEELKLGDDPIMNTMRYGFDILGSDGNNDRPVLRKEHTREDDGNGSFWATQMTSYEWERCITVVQPKLTSRLAFHWLIEIDIARADLRDYRMIKAQGSILIKSNSTQGANVKRNALTDNNTKIVPLMVCGSYNKKMFIDRPITTSNVYRSVFNNSEWGMPTAWGYSNESGGGFLLLLLVRLKLPTRCFEARWLAELCRMRLQPLGPTTMAPPPPHDMLNSPESLSVGEWRLPMLRLDIDDERFRFDEMPRELG